ncbi:MAG: hypothetical protein JST51_11495 [Armatimonadetes bacterium]|nr:hypothetical protein [Armatimonadota bacterium]
MNRGIGDSLVFKDTPSFGGQDAHPPRGLTSFDHPGILATVPMSLFSISLRQEIASFYEDLRLMS